MTIEGRLSAGAAAVLSESEAVSALPSNAAPTNFEHKLKVVEK